MGYPDDEKSNREDERRRERDSDKADNSFSLLEKARHEYWLALRKAGIISCQKPLVASMGKFAIESPFPTNPLEYLNEHGGEDAPPYVKEKGAEIDRFFNELLNGKSHEGV